ncbi:membrane-bound ClpP family serine protease [Pseudomonas nitritireducens]|uniref:Membrane-bound ClpP family serine protease n=1 Tax=Pseudomonas nitroreducens TaxID=46680 RepID=A0A7W7KLT8_PSENT|nr:hypothetical protein [Pseudomonas nitritireducens]MBB4864886.1 membrane-bound ClpP family serine protease [Pseudomonas nitritireducens]
MSRAALTLKYFAIYLMLLGIALVLLPNLLLTLFGMAPTAEVWVRVVGVLAFNIGLYYWFAARAECRELFVASVYTRAIVLASFAAFAALKLSEPVLVLFGAVDFCGGLWTLHALRKDRAS